MKKILLLLLLTCGFDTLYAQSTNSTAFSLGAELNLPQRSRYSIGYGVSGKLEIPVVSALSLSLSGAFTRLIHKSNILGSNNSAGADKFIPVKAGLKYYSSGRFYLEGELGSALQQGGDGQKLFLYSLGPGFLFPSSNNKTALDVGLRYESWANNRLNQLGVRVAYRFGGTIGN